MIISWTFDLIMAVITDLKYALLLSLAFIGSTLSDGGQYTDMVITTEGRFTFDGLDYEYDYAANESLAQHESCMGDYITCTLRLPYLATVCALNYYISNFSTYFSICEIEYLNCKYYVSEHQNNPYWSHEMNARWFDGDGEGCYEGSNYYAKQDYIRWYDG